MGVSRWGGPESREYPAFSMATQPIRQPLTTKETDLPCVAYIFTLFCFSFFFSPFISFYPSILSTVETSNPLFILPSFVSPSLSLHPFFVSFRFVSFIFEEEGGGGRNNTSSLQHRRSNFPSAKLVLTCLLYKLVPIYIYMRDSMRVYIGMRESTLILPTTDTTPSARLIRTWRL